MTYRFKVGDKVQFKSWEEMKKEYGVNCSWNDIPTPCAFVGSMDHLCGKRVKIIDIYKENKIGKLYDQRIEIEPFTDEYNYDNYMFKPVNDNPIFKTFKECL